MDSDLGSLTTLTARKTSLHLDLNTMRTQSLPPLCNYRERATDSNPRCENSIDEGLNSIEQLIASEISHTGDNLEDSLAAR